MSNQDDIVDAAIALEDYRTRLSRAEADRDALLAAAKEALNNLADGQTNEACDVLIEAAGKAEARP